MSIVKDLQRPQQTALRTTDLNTEEDQTQLWSNLSKFTQTAGKLAIRAMSEEIKNEKDRSANEILGNTTQDLYDYLSSSDLTPEEQNNAVQMTTSNLYKAGFKSSDIEAAYKLRGITDEKLLKDVKQAIDRNEEDQIQIQKNLEEAALTMYPDLSTQEAVQAYTKDLLNQKMLTDINSSLEDASPKTQELSWTPLRPNVSEEIVNQLRVASRNINGNWTEAALIDAEAQLTKQLLSKYPTMPTSMARQIVSDSMLGLRRASARTKGNMEELERYYDKLNKIMTDEALNGLLQKEFTVTHGNQTYTTTGAQLVATGKIFPDEYTAAVLQKMLGGDGSVFLGQTFSDQKVDPTQIRKGYNVSNGRSFLQNFPSFVNMTKGKYRENAIDVGLEVADINTENFVKAPKKIQANQYTTPLATYNSVVNDLSPEDLYKNPNKFIEDAIKSLKAFAQAGSQDTFLGENGFIKYDSKSGDFKYVVYDESQGLFIDKSKDGQWIALGDTPSVKFRDSLPQLKALHDNLVGKGLMFEDKFEEAFNNIMYTNTEAGQKIGADLVSFNKDPEAYRNSKVFPADPQGKTIDKIPVQSSSEEPGIFERGINAIVDWFNAPPSDEEVQNRVEFLRQEQQNQELREEGVVSTENNNVDFLGQAAAATEEDVEEGDRYSQEEFTDPVNLIKKNEGFVETSNPDTKGTHTLGHGRNYITNPLKKEEKALLSPENRDKKPEDMRLSLQEADRLLKHDIQKATETVKGVIPKFDKLDKRVQSVLIDICYQHGATGFKSYKELIKAINSGDSRKAAEEILDSKQYKIAKKNKTGDAKRFEHNAEILARYLNPARSSSIYAPVPPKNPFRSSLIPPKKPKNLR